MNASYSAANSGASKRESLFVACCVALIVTAMSFAIRGNLIEPLGAQFGLNKAQLGWIAGTAFYGFTLAMIIGGPLCDVVGMGRLLILAFIGHTIGIFLTIFATGFWTLYISTLIFGMANGFVEAACNPLIATMYPDQKIKRLGMFHAWFPGGITIGALVAYFIDKQGIGGKDHGWQIQMASMLIPLVIYGIMFLGKKFPVTERVASGVSTQQMFSACLKPFFLIFVLCMCVTATTELGPGTWITNILTFTTGAAGILFFAWQNILMALGRSFAGPIVHRLSPVAVLFGSATFSAIGLYLLSQAHSAPQGWAAITVFAIGVCFFWPTMLGTVSERFPKTGSLGLAIMGGAGMLANSFALPHIGHKYDVVTEQTAGGAAAMKTLQAAATANPTGAQAAEWVHAQATGGSAALLQLVSLPVLMMFAFGAIYLYDRSRGGYKKETLSETALENAEMTPANQA